MMLYMLMTMMQTWMSHLDECGIRHGATASSAWSPSSAAGQGQGWGHGRVTAAGTGPTTHIYTRREHIYVFDARSARIRRRYAAPLPRAAHAATHICIGAAPPRGWLGAARPSTQTHICGCVLLFHVLCWSRATQMPSTCSCCYTDDAAALTPVRMLSCYPST